MEVPPQITIGSVPIEVKTEEPMESEREKVAEELIEQGEEAVPESEFVGKLPTEGFVITIPISFEGVTTSTSEADVSFATTGEAQQVPSQLPAEVEKLLDQALRECEGAMASREQPEQQQQVPEQQADLSTTQATKESYAKVVSREAGKQKTTEEEGGADVSKWAEAEQPMETSEEARDVVSGQEEAEDLARQPESGTEREMKAPEEAEGVCEEEETEDISRAPESGTERAQPSDEKLQGSTEVEEESTKERGEEAEEMVEGVKEEGEEEEEEETTKASEISTERPSGDGELSEGRGEELKETAKEGSEEEEEESDKLLKEARDEDLPKDIPALVHDIEELSIKEVEEAKHIVVVTGGSRGLGFAIVKGILMHKPSWTVYLTSRDDKRGMDAVKKLHTDFDLTAHYHQLDIDSSVSIRNFRDYLKHKHPKGITCLINNAGIFPATPYQPNYSTFEQAYVEDIIRKNYFSTLAVCIDLMPLIADDGKVIFVSSRMAQLAFANTVEVKQDKFRACLRVEDVSALMESLITTDQLAAEGWLMTAPNVEILRGYTLGPIYPFGMSKLGLNLLAKFYQSRCDEEKGSHNLHINACCPGLVKTDSNPNGTKTPEDGADSIIWLALESEKSTIKGQFCADHKVLDPFFISKDEAIF